MQFLCMLVTTEAHALKKLSRILETLGMVGDNKNKEQMYLNDNKNMTRLGAPGSKRTPENSSRVKLVHRTSDFINYCRKTSWCWKILIVSKRKDLASGLDRIPGWILKDFAGVLSAPICAIYNSSIRTGVGGGIREKMLFFSRSTPLRICGYVSQEEGKLFRWNTIRVTPPYIPSEGVGGPKKLKIAIWRFFQLWR